MYKECIDASFDCVKAAERCAYDLCSKSDEHAKYLRTCVLCADVCDLIAKLCAGGMATKEAFEFCAKTCEDSAKKCESIDHEYAKKFVEEARKCADKCGACSASC